MCVVSIFKCHTLSNVQLNKIRVCVEYGIQIICYDVDRLTDRRHCEEARLLCRTVYKAYLQ